VGGALPASPNPTRVAGNSPIGINLCLRQPMRCSSRQFASCRDHRKETNRSRALFTPANEVFQPARIQQGSQVTHKKESTSVYANQRALPASPNPTGVAGNAPIGINLCLRQPMRSLHTAVITEKKPIGVELCLRQPMRSSSSQPESNRVRR
jgi:hypothetical protein